MLVTNKLITNTTLKSREASHLRLAAKRRGNHELTMVKLTRANIATRLQDKDLREDQDVWTKGGEMLTIWLHVIISSPLQYLAASCREHLHVRDTPC